MSTPTATSSPKAWVPSASGVARRVGRTLAAIRGRGGYLWVMLPGLAFLAVVFVYPALIMVARSFTDPSPANYTSLVESDFYVRVLLQTLETGVIVTVVCLLLGYPYAYLLSRVSRTWRLVLLATVLLPFWTSWLVRTFAWMALLRDTGLINEVLQTLGMIDQPLTLIRNTLGVTIGMSYIMLPFMILPLYAVMTRIDWSLVRAARSLGASSQQAFARVFLPLSLPGIVAGSFLVFVVSVGFYITPALLGSPENMMLGELIATRFSQDLEFGEGSALAVVLLATVALIVVLASRLAPVMRLGHGVNDPEGR